MNVNDLLIFVEVVECGGFTAAGEKLAMPKSNVSRSLTRLENELQVKLLERSTRSHHLTEVGRTIYQHGCTIKEAASSAVQASENAVSHPIGELKVCASISVGQHLLAPLFTQFQQQNPKLKLNIKLTNRRVDLIEEDIDIAIRVGSLSDSNLIAKRLCTQNLQLYASTEYLSKHSLISSCADLSHHSLLFHQSGGGVSPWQLYNDKQKFVLPAQAATICNDFAVLRQMVLDGAGIAKLPEYLVNDLLKQGLVKPVLADWQGESVDIHTVVASRQGMSLKVRAFLDYLHKQF